MLPGIAEDKFSRPQQILPGQSLIGLVVRLRPGRQPADARLRNAVEKAEMLMSALRPRARRAEFRIDDPDRGTEKSEQLVLVEGRERSAGPGDHEHSVDPVRDELRQPGRDRGIMQSSDRRRVTGALLERRIQMRQTHADQLDQPVFGQSEVQPIEIIAALLTKPFAPLDHQIALPRLVDAGNPVDHMPL